MNFCSNCGSDQIVQEIPTDDHRLREICKNCDTIHYSNPNMVVGCLIEHNGKIMLAKRGIEPRKNYWNLPCGFLENGETIEEGAIREVLEETGAQVSLGHLHAVYNLPHAQQVYLIFVASMLNEHFETTVESTEIQFFNKNEIPWTDIAFSSNTFALEQYFNTDLNRKHTYIGTFRK
jgi:ADP-ribose pyrophosphatase YjhB (NUDIX family)